MESNYFMEKNADWRKKAAMTAVNDLDVEKAFADQASGFVENKLEPLMKAPYNIGFEVVRKNDDNTRLIGIFAFKVDDHLLFAPVFFLNGEIKGPLLYRCDTKTFVPANKEWATYLISALESEEGKGISRSRRNEHAPLVQMQRINFVPNGVTKRASVVAGKNEPSCTCSPIPTPEGNCTVVIAVTPDYSSSATWNNRLPGGQNLLKMAAADDGTIRCSCGPENFMLSKQDGEKLASAEGNTTITSPAGSMFKLSAVETSRVRTAFFTNVPDYTDQWESSMMTAVKQAGAQVGVLRDFLNEPGFGRPAAEAIVKAASDRNFAEAVAECYSDPTELFPAAFTEIEKKASAPGELVIKYDVTELPKEDRIRSEFFRDGFYILDSRPAETMSVVTEETPNGISAITTPGVYSVLREDGKFEDNVFVAPFTPYLPVSNHGKMYSHDCCVHYGEFDTSKPSVVAIKDGKLNQANKTLMGCQTESPCSFSGFTDKVEAKSLYMVYINEVAYGPITVHEVNNVDGVQYIKAGCSSGSRRSEGNMTCWVRKYDLTPITINKEVAKSDIDKGVLGADAKFIKLNYTKEETAAGWEANDLWKDCGTARIDHLEHLGTIDNLDDFIFSSWKLPTVKIRKEVTTTKSASYRFSDGKKESSAMNRCEALVKLARDMGIAAPQAYDILKKVEDNGSHKFYLEPGEKVAMRLRVVDRPNFDDEFDSEFGIPMQPTKEYHLRVQGDQMFEPASAIGDMMNPTTVTGLPDATVVTTKTEDLRALADTYKLPHVFEHSVVGTLADTFDAMMLLDKYVPRIEDAVDSLFRLLFLLYWRPGDFERAYGVDDMPNLEAETISNGDALGAMLLRLLKKTEAYKKGVLTRSKQDQGQR